MGLTVNILKMLIFCQTVQLVFKQLILEKKDSCNVIVINVSNDFSEGILENLNICGFIRMLDYSDEYADIKENNVQDYLPEEALHMQAANTIAKTSGKRRGAARKEKERGNKL